MACLLAILTGFFPRVGLLIVWIFTNEVDQAYDTFILPLLGLIFLPLTTLVYALFYTPIGGVDGIEWFWVACVPPRHRRARRGRACPERRLAPTAAGA